jgi:hypothetical protein
MLFGTVYGQSSRYLNVIENPDYPDIDPDHEFLIVERDNPEIWWEKTESYGHCIIPIATDPTNFIPTGIEPDFDMFDHTLYAVEKWENYPDDPRNYTFDVTAFDITEFPMVEDRVVIYFANTDNTYPMKAKLSTACAPISKDENGFICVRKDKHIGYDTRIVLNNSPTYLAAVALGRVPKFTNKIGFTNRVDSNYCSIREVITHELGHIMGIAHPTNNNDVTNLMNSQLNLYTEIYILGNDIGPEDDTSIHNLYLNTYFSVVSVDDYIYVVLKYDSYQMNILYSTGTTLSCSLMRKLIDVSDPYKLIGMTCSLNCITNGVRNN